MEHATAGSDNSKAKLSDKERHRRHFKEDFKKKVVADVLSGRVDKNNVKDMEGNKISKYLVDRWKAEYRGSRFMVDALSQARMGAMSSAATPDPTASFTVDDLYKEVVKLSIENRKLKEILAINLDLPKSNEMPYLPSKAYPKSF